MSDENQRNGIKKQFREALQVLAVDAASQVKCTEPGDVPVEICEDYLHWSEVYISTFSRELSEHKIKEIKALFLAVNELTENAFCDTNMESMLHPEWEPLRQNAKLVLNILDWPIEAPQGYYDLGSGVYKRD
ncbi:hypothetical protein [Pseudoalteromonas luteoviolacea]|uniref:hypothetical protein n=1 Tax=Pseudoalteromonas luteoviolacea TaxID=43657 RepID=UPI001B38A5CB|nr:hypothetical protein [Pseudoalteromonas luteoviolacea]MBQ4834797.1 hypothetical protein [Pseudoalteromonas luteoviolacea]